MNPQSPTTPTTAGRDVDAEIAVKVFGWEWLEKITAEPIRKGLFPPDCEEWIRWNFEPLHWRKAGDSTPRFSDWDRCCAQRDDENKLGNKRIWGLPYYSRDISAAMEVADKVEVNKLVFEKLVDGWGCEIRVKREWFIAAAPTRPMALCLAALKAVGGRGE